MSNSIPFTIILCNSQKNLKTHFCFFTQVINHKSKTKAINLLTPEHALQVYSRFFKLSFMVCENSKIIQNKTYIFFCSKKETESTFFELKDGCKISSLNSTVFNVTDLFKQEFAKQINNQRKVLYSFLKIMTCLLCPKTLQVPL